MSTQPSHLSYPGPRAVRRRLWTFLGAASASLLVAFVGASAAFALAFGGMGAVLVLRALA